MKRFLTVLALITLLAACKEEVAYPDLTYKCECGSINWDGSAIDLTDSHYITVATDTTDLGLEFDLAKDYFTTAKIEDNSELEPHHINMKISVPDLTLGISPSVGAPVFYDFEEGIFSVNIEEVNYNSISTVDEFAVNAGSMTISTELGSPMDQVTFEFEIFQTVNGSAAGVPFIYTGSFSSIKEEL